MAKKLSKSVKNHLEKSRASAIAAVDVYNRPGPRFRTPHYIVLIVMAWTSLMHAIFYKRGIRPWYKKSGKRPEGDRYIRVDGDPKHWDLTECLKQFFQGDHPPERKNLEFLIGLRNKIEHRHLPDFDAGLYGECQAALLNLEVLISDQFGQQYALTDQLAVSLQFSGLVPSEKKNAAKRLASVEAKTIKDYVEKFRSNLPSSTLNSTKYSFNVFLVPKVANRIGMADVSVEFIPVNEASKVELERLEKLNVLIKEKHIPISNLDLYKPSEVVKRVQTGIPHRFSQAAHSAAWRCLKVRPSYGSETPHATDSKYCVYDAVHKDYLYTEAWIQRLLNDLADPEKFKAMTGFIPRTN